MNEGEDDILIAKFMGWEGAFLDRDAIHHDHIAQAEAIPPKGRENWNVYTVSLRYRYSWDWLMPVVEKIWDCIGNRESLFYFTNDDVNIISIHNTSSNIGDCYGAVVEFIKYYNKGN